MPRSKARKKNHKKNQVVNSKKNQSVLQATAKAVEVKKLSRLEKSKYRREKRTPEIRILKQVSDTLGILMPHLEKPKPELLDRILRTPRLIPDLKLEKSRWANRQHMKSLDLAYQSSSDKGNNWSQVLEGPVHLPFQGSNKTQFIIELLSLPAYCEPLQTSYLLIGSLFSFDALKEKNSHWHLTPENYLTIMTKIFELQSEKTEFRAWIERGFIYHQTISHYHFFGPEGMIKLWDILARVQTPNQKTKTGHTPFSLLCTHLAHPLHPGQDFFSADDDRKLLIKWLLDHGVDPNTVETGDQFSPLEEISGIARYHKNKRPIAEFSEADREEIVYLLGDAGADPKGYQNNNLRPVITLVQLCQDQERRGRLIKYLTTKGDNDSDLTEVCQKMMKNGEKLDHKVVQLLKYQGRLTGLDQMFLDAFLENKPGDCDQVLDFLGGELTVSLQDVITNLAKPRSKQLKTVDVFSFQPFQPQNPTVQKQMAQCVSIGKKFLETEKGKIQANNQCYICMESVGGQVTRGCDNGHYFHEQCILQWLQKEKSCPTCRKSLSSDSPWVRLRELSPEEIKAIEEEEARVDAAIAKKKSEDVEAQKKAKILADAQAKSQTLAQNSVPVN